jgi:hypothetical protein
MVRLAPRPTSSWPDHDPADPIAILPPSLSAGLLGQLDHKGWEPASAGSPSRSAVQVKVSGPVVSWMAYRGEKKENPPPPPEAIPLQTKPNGPNAVSNLDTCWQEDSAMISNEYSAVQYRTGQDRTEVKTRGCWFLAPSSHVAFQHHDSIPSSSCSYAQRGKVLPRICILQRLRTHAAAITRPPSEHGDELPCHAMPYAVRVAFARKPKDQFEPKGLAIVSPSCNSQRRKSLRLVGCRPLRESISKSTVRWQDRLDQGS